MEAAELVLALLEAGLTQQVIAERTGVHQTTVSKLARGEINDVLSRNYRALLSLHAKVCVPAVQIPAPVVHPRRQSINHTHPSISHE